MASFVSLVQERGGFFQGLVPVALQDVPDGHGQLAGDRYRGLVLAAAQGDGEAPLLQRVDGGEQPFAGFDEQCAQVAHGLVVRIGHMHRGQFPGAVQAGQLAARRAGRS